ncbi:tape measure protein [Mycobacterium phage SororFago]|nr:tape measure protein [Mycobacterium phage SororFago]
MAAKKAGMATGVEVAQISVKVSPNSKAFRSELQRDLDAIEKSVSAKIAVEPDMGNFRKEVKAKTAGMSTKVDVDADVDKSMFQRIRDQFSKLADKIPMPSFGSGINLAGYAVILAAIGTLSPLIVGLMGALTTGLLALPGLIAGIAIPIGALALGMDGLKKAAERLKEPFDALKKTMSENVEEQFTPVFEKLRDIFPSLKSTLPAVTQGLASMAQSIVDVVTSPQNLAKVEGIIRNIAGGLEAAAPGMASFTQGFIDLIAAFSTKFPDLGKWFSDTGASFSKWITDFTTKGPDGMSKFDHALDGLGFTLKELGGGLVDIAGKALDFFSDPEKVKSFKAELQAVIDLIQKIMDLLTRAAAAMNDFGLFKGEGNAGDLLPAPMQWAKDGFDSIDFSGIWDGIKNSASEAWSFIQGVWAPVGSFFSTIFTPIAQIATPIWGVISAAATQAWNIISALWGGAAAFLGGIFSGLAGPASTAWNAVSSAAQVAWGVVQAAWGAFSGWFSGIWSQVSGIVQGVWNTVVAIIQGAANNVINVINTMGSNIVSAITSIDLASAGRALIEKFIGGIKSMAGAVKDAVGSVVGGVLNMIPHSPAKEGPLSGSGWLSIFTGGQALGDQFGAGLENGLQSTLEMAKDMAEQIKQAMDAGTDQTGALAGIDTKDLKKSMDVIEQEKKRLKLEKNALPDSDKEGRKALQNQIDQLQAQKDILAYQKDRLKNEEAYGDEAGDDPLVKAAADLMNAPVDFAKATGKQFLSDLGISGNGLVSKLLTEGTKYIFQIGSVDEAMSIKERQERTDAMTVTGPSR